MVLLATELRLALDALGPRDGGGGAGPQRRLLTAAVPGYSGDMSGLDLASLAAQLDYFNIMSCERRCVSLRIYYACLHARYHQQIKRGQGQQSQHHVCVHAM